MPDLLAKTDILGSSLFWGIAVFTVSCAMGVAFARDIVRASTLLFLTLLGVAGIYLSLGAEFIAATQVVIYAGGTLILIVFAVMLTGKSPYHQYRPRRHEVWAAGLVAVGLMALGLKGLLPLANKAGTSAVPDASPGVLGLLLASDWLLPFELVSVLLLVVMLGAAYLARIGSSRKQGETP